MKLGNNLLAALLLPTVITWAPVAEAFFCFSFGSGNRNNQYIPAVPVYYQYRPLAYQAYSGFYSHAGYRHPDGAPNYFQNRQPYRPKANFCPAGRKSPGCF